MSRLLCVGKPPEWWDTGDGGNRLALGICGLCPVNPRCGRSDRRPYGVIRAGTAYDDAGTPLQLCGCGYPRPADNLNPCPRCTIPDVAIPDAKTIRNRSLRLLAAAGVTDQDISVELGLAVETVEKLRRKAGFMRREFSQPRRQKVQVAA